MIERAIALHQAGQLPAALAAYDAALARQPRLPAALRGRGLVLAELGRMAEALAAFEALLAAAPGDPEARQLRDLAAAELAGDDPRLASGLDHAAAGRLREALAAFEAVLAAEPGHLPAAVNRAMVLLDLGEAAAALAGFDGALARPDAPPQAHFGRGQALQALGQPAAALAALGAAHHADPANAGFAVAYADLAVRHGQPAAAVAAYGTALAQGADAGLFNNRGVARLALADPAGALADFDAALAQDPRHAQAAANRGEALGEMGRWAEAHAALVRAARLAPETPAARLQRRHLAMHLAAWDGLAEDLVGLDSGAPAPPPFQLLALLDDPALHRRVAARWLAERGAGTVPPPLAAQPRVPHRPLRVGWLSADFFDHATLHLALEVLEAHDPARVAVTALSYGPAPGDAWQQRVAAAARLIDIRGQGDGEVVDLCRHLGLDVLIDLKGLTGNPRPGILAGRAAPCQVNWLGYPGTLPGADWLIADRVVVPAAERPHYAEAIAWLPYGYQPNGRLFPVAAAPTRAELELPDGPLLGCFNQAYKLLPAVFDAWLAILAAVPAASLWLWVEVPAARDRLHARAAAAGIDPARLVFAGLAPRAAHLARLAVLDLFLDTAPYGAHTSASDALRAGVPVLTCPGRSFASRVAASLLTTMDLPELVVPDRAAYVATAVALAGDPARLANLKARVAAARLTAPLFDPQRFAGVLERALELMVDRAAAGLPPADFDVPA